MKAVPIDIDYLIFAYQDESPDNAYYLDTEYGDVRLVNRNLQDLKDLTDEIEKSEGRLLYVPKPPKNLLIDDLKQFLQTIESAELKSLLPIAFESPHVVETYKKIMARIPSELARLDDYLAAQTKMRVAKWLSANAIEATKRDSQQLSYVEHSAED